MNPLNTQETHLHKASNTNPSTVTLKQDMKFVKS